MFVISYKYHNSNIFTHNHFFNTIFNSAEVDTFFLSKSDKNWNCDIYFFLISFLYEKYLENWIDWLIGI